MHQFYCYTNANPGRTRETTSTNPGSVYIFILSVPFIYLSVNFVNHYCLLWKWPLMGGNMLAINICSQKVSNHWFCVTMIHPNQLPLVRHLNPVVGPRKNLQRFGLAWTKSRRPNVTFFKVVFKIHFRPFWVILVKKNSGEKKGGGLILSHFLVDFGILKIFTSVRHFKGAKNTFFQKVP